MGWDGLYVLKRLPYLHEKAKLEPAGGTLFEKVWNIPSVDLPTCEYGNGVLPDDALATLTDVARAELKKLPPDLTVWERKVAPPYCGGLGGVYAFHRVSHQV